MIRRIVIEDTRAMGYTFEPIYAKDRDGVLSDGYDWRVSPYASDWTSQILDKLNDKQAFITTQAQRIAELEAEADEPKNRKEKVMIVRYGGNQFWHIVYHTRTIPIISRFNGTYEAMLKEAHTQDLHVVNYLETDAEASQSKRDSA